MYAGSQEARRYALGLLLAGMSPEQAEGHLAGRLVQREAPSALTDPNNDPVFKEVDPMAQPTQRGPVDIKGVTTRTSETWDRRCEACKQRIHRGSSYERVARDSYTFESYHPECFVEEFGERRLYGA